MNELHLAQSVAKFGAAGVLLSLVAACGGGGGGGGVQSNTASSSPASAQASTTSTLTSSGAPVGPTWTIVDLGSLGEDNSVATGINNVGQIVGVACLTPDSAAMTCDAFVADAGGANVRLIAPSGTYNTYTLGQVYASAGSPWNQVWINNAGQIFTNTTTGPIMAAAHVPGVTSLGPKTTTIYGANDFGDVIETTKLGDDLFVTRADGVNPTQIFGTKDVQITAVSSINNKGQIAGNSYFGTGLASTLVPYITGANATGFIQLSSMGSDSIVVAMNDSGQLAGIVNNSKIRTGFLTGPNGVGVSYLGDTQSATFPVAINSSGQILGQNFIYANGVLTRLDTLPAVQTAGWSEISAFAMNDSTQIVGYGMIGGAYHAFLLTNTGN
jgi:hypothetical protein